MSLKIFNDIINESSKVLIERIKEVKFIVAAMIADGHVLLEGVPGIAKTMTAKTVARMFDLDFKRVQMTPDLLPGDLLGAYVYDQKTSEFKIRKGPIFTNIFLADEINRASPRTQSALLEAMQERQVTIEGNTFKLDDPFIVIATQNPIEMEGTFPLPEAQLDRFLIKLEVGYPTTKSFSELIKRIDQIEQSIAEIKPIATKDDLINLKNNTKNIRADDAIINYIVEIVEETRKHPAVKLGGSPRAGIAIYKIARAWAMIDERNYVIPDDIKNVAKPALAHRIILNPEYEFEGITPSKVIDDILNKIPTPKP
ncbi:MAG: MoxR family ATPase [Thermoprotei archaeon]